MVFSENTTHASAVNRDIVWYDTSSNREIVVTSFRIIRFPKEWDWSPSPNN